MKVTIKYKLYLIKQKLLNSVFKKKQTIYPSGWFGNYDKWEDVEKVKASILKVKNGEAVYERDSVLFDEIHYSQPLLSAFDKSIIDNRLHIVDFGGSLVSSYFKNRKH